MTIQSIKGKSFDSYWFHKAKILTEYVVLLYIYASSKFGDNRIEITTFLKFCRKVIPILSYEIHIVYLRTGAFWFTFQ